MRLSRLDLTRYGRFTDHRIDFGAQPADGPDLHLIYGPNEAGKSTTLNAFLDLLYGIEPRSDYNFLHDYQTMRIDARLDLASGPRELARLRKGLVDADGAALADGVLLGELAGIDRPAYQAMFSLDDDTLEAGGDSILESKGELGELLFSATTGLAGLSRRLAGLGEEAGEFFRPKGRKTALKALKDRLAALKTRRDEIDVLAPEYRRLLEARDRADAAYRAALADRGRVSARRDEILRVLNALPRLRTLRALRDELAPLADLPTPPAAWTEDLAALRTTEVTAATRKRTIEEEIARLDAEIETTVPDPTAIALADRVETWPALEAAYDMAEEALPGLRLDLGEAERTVEALLLALGRGDAEDPEALIPSAATVAILRRLIEGRSGIAARLETASAELRRARAAAGLAERRLAEAGDGADPAADPGPETDPAAEARLTAALDGLRQGDHRARIALADRAIEETGDALAEHLAGLAPWRGDADDLAALEVPAPAEIDRLEDRRSRATQSTGDLARQVADLETESRRLSAEIDASTADGVISDATLTDSREAREAAWRAHRAALDPRTAEAFEEALRRDDQTVERHLRQGESRAALNQLVRQRARVDSDLAAARDRLADATREREAADAAATAMIAGLSERFPSETTLGQIRSWLDRREQALRIRAELRRARRDRRDAAAGLAAAHDRLAEALRRLGHRVDPDTPLDRLLDQAQSTLDRQAELDRLRQACAAAREDLTERARLHAEAEAASEAWTAEWTRACAATWFADPAGHGDKSLGGAEDATGTAVVAELLDTLGQLGPALRQRDGLATRIQALEQDRQRLDAEVSEVERLLETAAGDLTPPQRARRIREAVDRALALQARREELVQRKAKAQDRHRDVDRAVAENRALIAERLAFFEVDTLDAVEARLRDCARRAELREQLAVTEAEILDGLGLDTLGAAETLLDATDRPALDAELAELETRFADEDQRCRDLFAERRTAEDRLAAIGGDDGVARIETERRTTLLEIEEGAERYLRLRFGVLAAEHALRTFRERHRGAMMTRASNAFAAISEGRYSGLAAQPDGEREVLVALARAGGSKTADSLSKGTRFQLYLALRVAGYHEFARTRQPVPFIADDIMETFDDDRAARAFALFADMARIGQVIYLTHHRHLVEIARDICPTLRLHTLD